MLSPIVIFAFNRPQSLLRLLESLRKNELAAESDVFFFVDGAREGRPNEVGKVEETRQVANAATGFSNVTCRFSEKNKGLGTSIIYGISEVVQKYGKVIVLEDDLVLTPNFLQFMNQGLDRYENEQKVFSVCGYSNRVTPPKDYAADAYFCTRSSSWGWGTWKDRFERINWSPQDQNHFKHLARSFNRWGGSDCYKLLQRILSGNDNNWDALFSFAQFLENGLSLFPIVSKVKNCGFESAGTEEATHTKHWSRFVADFDEKATSQFIFPKELSLNQNLFKQAMRYNSIPLRAWSRLMYAWCAIKEKL